jgi:threonine/homoserine/homoserine lactone efflux protein
VGVAALLVLSPGPTLAIVTRNAAAYGRGPGLATAAGIGVANATYATAAALGLSVVLQRSPAAFTVIRLAGAAYLVWLGATGLWRVARGQAGPPRVGADGAGGTITAAAGFRQGVLTNLLHPSIAVFYLSYIPQFIRAGQPFLARYTLLAAIHVALSTGWMATCAVAIDQLARVLRTPAFARTVETLAGLSLLVLGGVVAIGR